MNPGSIFAKVIALFMFAISFIIPASPDNLEISVEVSSAETQIIYVEWKNNTKKAITEPRYYIEKLENGQWTEVPFSFGFGFPDIYTQHYPTESGKITINTSTAFDEKLPSGTYRITLYYELLLSDISKGCARNEFEII